MQKTLATLPSTKIIAPKDPLEYRDPSSTRRWELTINWKTKVYLTDQEKVFFMAALKSGKKIIQVGDLVLTKRFDCLVPLTKPKVEPLSEKEKEEIMEKARKETHGKH